MATTPKAKALFLDRDGVINEEASYLWRREDVHFVPGIFSLCRTAQSLGYRLVVVTNQAGIGRGMYTEAEFHTLMDWMREQFARESITLDAIYFSPYHPEHGVGDYKRDHEDRKPGTGMLRRAVTDLGISLADSILIGDRCTDIAARQHRRACARPSSSPAQNPPKPVPATSFLSPPSPKSSPGY